MILTDEFLGIVMEFANGGDLFDYVKDIHKRERGFKETMARCMFQQIIIAVDYCHRRGVVNRDLKPENILVHWCRLSPCVKMCDFGFSKSLITQVCDTPMFCYRQYSGWNSPVHCMLHLRARILVCKSVLFYHQAYLMYSIISID